MGVRGPLLSVTYTGEPDVVHEFGQDGQAVLFGRDDERCDVPIWSAISGSRLSRIAGRIWRVGDELWLRNLSHHHELEIAVPGQPVEAPLPPRRADGFDRGPARSLPGELSFVRGPDGCELLVRQERSSSLPPGWAGADPHQDDTEHLTAIPLELHRVAVALCEPLLAGEQLPATYAQVGARAGSGTTKQTRTLVGRLCALYAAEVPQLRERVGERMSRELDLLGIAADPRLRHGVWTFEEGERDALLQSERRRALALPDYFEVAHLLVRRGLVTRADVDRLA